MGMLFYYKKKVMEQILKVDVDILKEGLSRSEKKKSLLLCRKRYHGFLVKS